MPALSDYKSTTLTYGELAKEIETLVLLWKNAGLKKGDKIAINARSSAAWAKLFYAAQAGGFVAVQIFNAFTPSDTENLVNHSESRILYTEEAIFEKMDFDRLPGLVAALDAKSGELLASRGAFPDLYNTKDEAFAKVHADQQKSQYEHIFPPFPCSVQKRGELCQHTAIRAHFRNDGGHDSPAMLWNASCGSWTSSDSGQSQAGAA